MWKQILGVATLGTERSPLPAWSSDGKLGAWLAALDGRDPEDRLLAAAAAFSLRARAGWLPTQDPAPQQSAAPEERIPACSALAEERVKTLLQGRDIDFLPEWLEAAAAAGRRLPHAQLPAFLELGRTRPQLETAIAGVLGERGRWLASQNPVWHRFQAAQPISGETEAWQTGSRPERMALLRQLRTQPATTARARELLSSTWNEETPEDRAAFVEELAAGLGLDDEAFLESVLNDRRRPVRRAAAGLLARLPGSALCQRMVVRFRSSVGRDQKGLKVSLPTTCDSDMIRDGIEPKPRFGTGERAWWLLQLLALTPPVRMAELLGETPGRLVELAKRSDWELVLLEGWMMACARHRDAEWAEVLLETVPRSVGDFDRDDLLQVLPVPRREAVISRLLAATPEPLLGGQTALTWLQHSSHRWSEDFSRTVLQVVQAHIARPPTVLRLPLRAALPGFGTCFHPAVLDSLKSLLSGITEGAWLQTLTELTEIVAFRKELLRELNL